MYRMFKVYILFSCIAMGFAGFLRNTMENMDSLMNGNDNSLSVENEKIEWELFMDFQSKFQKRYESLENFKERFSIFRDNVRKIEQHNKDFTQNFTMSINHFADLTEEEFRNNFITGLKTKDFSSKGYTSYGCKPFTSNSNVDNLPSSIDWRDKGAVTSVKDQGQCGSCWTFSSTAAAEGAWAISTGELVNLAEQELVDCATGVKYGSHGCSGGQMDGAFKYLIEHGQCLDTEYPYTSGTTKTEGTCKTCTSVAKFSSCSDVSPNNELSLKAAVFQQPVAVAIEADTRYFQFYSGGVLDSAECGTKLDHGVLVAGYGEEDGKKFWLVKNSWSVNWGEDGYVKIGRSDSANTPGICGIAMDASFISV